MVRGTAQQRKTNHNHTTLRSVTKDGPTGEYEDPSDSASALHTAVRKAPSAISSLDNMFGVGVSAFSSVSN